MKFKTLKYFLTFCIALTLFLKVSHALQYLSSFQFDIENVVSDHSDATEKEDKKIEAEYVNHSFSFTHALRTSFPKAKKIIIPNYPFLVNHSPEVLTPPPSV